MGELLASTGDLPSASDLQPQAVLDLVELALVRQRPFGDSTYILQQYQASCLRRLRIIGVRLPGAQHLASVLETVDEEVIRRVTGNTVVRCAIQHAHTQVATDDVYGLPLDTCDEVFDIAAKHVHVGGRGTPLDDGPFQLPKLGDQQYHGWIWREDYPDDLFGRSFRFLIERNYGDALRTPGPDDIAALHNGEQLLRRLLPKLTPSALSHVHLVGLFPSIGYWRDKASSSQIRLGGSIFLGGSLLSSPWAVAEHILHEALHQKLYDFRHGHTLLEDDFAQRGAPRVRALWNPAQLNDANSWDAHRAFAAFHVYVQLYLLARVAEVRQSELEAIYGSMSGMISADRAFGRAWYLGEQLKESCWGVLGLAGQRLVDWLRSILETLEPNPPPRGARVHLLFDLYNREGKKVDAALRRSRSSTHPLSAEISSLARQELDAARGFLAEPAEGGQGNGLSALRERCESPDSAPRFSEIREAIAGRILAACDDRDRLTAPTLGGLHSSEFVDNLVTSSSRRLHELLNGLPSSVARAKERANTLRFSASCIDDVGRLLATLAAAVPIGGRILEIGTGVGVGTSWLCSGLGGRTDVEVVSVEMDADLSDAARQEKWPSYVNLLTADALMVCSTLGTFDLMFLDASPVKHGHLQETLALLRQRGVMVIDDLHSDLKNTAEQQAKKDVLRRDVLHHPALQALELDWASGVILATRVVDVN